MEEYIDTRGIWPVYVKGLFTMKLEGFLRSVTIDRARVEVILKSDYEFDKFSKQLRTKLDL